MNVGSENFQHLARVEVPAWVAEDKANIALIQAALWDQTRIMGTKPYPYLLHRSHEVAVVSLDEHRRVEQIAGTKRRDCMPPDLSELQAVSSR